MLKKLIRKFRYGQKGFTLIELLVVVAIIGVLAAVVVPNIGKFVGSGNEAAAAAELKTIQAAVVAYMADTQTPDFGEAGTDTDTLDLSAYLSDALQYGPYNISTDGMVTRP